MTLISRLRFRTTMQPEAASAENRLAKPIALPPPIKARLSALSFLFQESDIKTFQRALESLVESLPKPDQDLIRTLEDKLLQRSGLLPPDPEKPLAQLIREFAEEKYVRPARERGDRELAIEVKEIHRELGLHQRYAAVMSALQGKAFLRSASVELIDPVQTSDGEPKVLAYRLL